MQKACGHPIRGSHSPGAHDFRVSFTPLEGVLFTFPSRYSFAIGRRQYSALWDGPHGFGRGFTCPDLLGIRHGGSALRAWGCHPPRPDFPDGRARASLSFMPSRNPGGHVRRFGLVRVRSPLLAESLLISSPRGTEMFHFPRSRLRPLLIHGRMARSRAPDCSIRKPMGQRPPAPRHGLSRLAASFVARRRQGIRHAPEELGRRKCGRAPVRCIHLASDLLFDRF